MSEHDSGCSGQTASPGLSETTFLPIQASSLCSSEVFQHDESSNFAGTNGGGSQEPPWQLAVHSDTNKIDGTAASDNQSETAGNISQLIRQQLALESQVSTGPHFLALHCQSSNADAHITPRTRMLVVSWMVEVGEEFRLQQETLHLAVGLLDRFIACSEDLPRCVLQLLAVTCILLATKHLEVVQLSVEQLCNVTDNHYRPHDLLRMERIVLDTLEFRLTGPSGYTFLHLLAQACSNWVTPTVLSLAMYLCELSMLEYYACTFSYSCRAAASLLLAQISVGDQQHTAAVVQAVMDCMAETVSSVVLGPCMFMLLQLQQVAYQQTLAAALATRVTAPEAAAAAAAAVGTTLGPSAAAAAASSAEDLLAPLRVKYGAECWCMVSAAAPLGNIPPVFLSSWV